MTPIALIKSGLQVHQRLAKELPFGVGHVVFPHHFGELFEHAPERSRGRKGMVHTGTQGVLADTFGGDDLDLERGVVVASARLVGSLPAGRFAVDRRRALDRDWWHRPTTIGAGRGAFASDFRPRHDPIILIPDG